MGRNSKVMEPLRSPASYVSLGTALCCILATLACATHSRLVQQDEAAIVNDLRAIQSAEAAYMASNGGVYDVPRCLATPWDCIPNYPKFAPSFLPVALGTLLPENGYARTFHAGKALDTKLGFAFSSKTSIREWAYTAVPVRDARGRKSFCTDTSGRICAFLDGSIPRVENAQCPSPCERIQ